MKNETNLEEKWVVVVELRRKINFDLCPFVTASSNGARDILGKKVNRYPCEIIRSIFETYISRILI